MKTREIILLLLIFFISSSYAQDLIVTNEGSHIINNKVIRELRNFIHRMQTTWINGKTIDRFIKELEQKKIDVVIDIRENTFYKSNQGFSPESLKSVLEIHNIEYFYLQDFGNPFHNKEYKNNPQKSKEMYLSLFYSDLFVKNNIVHRPKKVLRAFFTKIAHKRKYKKKVFCFICYCNTEDPTRCHRFWLKEKLINLKRIELGLSGDYILIKEISEMIA